MSKKIQVATYSALIGGNPCHTCMAINVNGNLEARTCTRPRDARRSFEALCKRLGIPKTKYEFV